MKLFFFLVLICLLTKNIFLKKIIIKFYITFFNLKCKSELNFILFVLKKLMLVFILIFEFCVIKI